MALVAASALAAPPPPLAAPLLAAPPPLATPPLATPPLTTAFPSVYSSAAASSTFSASSPAERFWPTPTAAYI